MRENNPQTPEAVFRDLCGLPEAPDLPSWLLDQMDASAREILPLGLAIAAADPDFAEGRTQSVEHPDLARQAGVRAVFMALEGRKRWFCAHFAKQMRSDVPGPPMFAGVSEGIGCCERPQCVAWAARWRALYEVDQHCDICDEHVPDNGFTPHLIIVPPFTIKFHACDGCARWYRYGA